MVSRQEQTFLRRARSPEKIVVLPLCPSSGRPFETGVYRHFMKNFRQFPDTAAEIRVLTSIQAAAAAMGISPALAAKTLVDIGLRAPRMAFPFSFLAWCKDTSPFPAPVPDDQPVQT